MNALLFFYVVVLFFVLTPGILLRLPPNSGKFTVAAVHALVFALVLKFSHIAVNNLGASIRM